MSNLRVCLFGGLLVTWDGTPLPAIASSGARSLFAYLLTYRDRPHTRDLLAGTFWPDLPEAVARRRLSQALWQIRNALDPHRVLLTKGDTVQWNPSLPLWLDTEEFPRQQAQGTSEESRAIEHYELCVGHYTGEFLAGYYDDWIVVERERLREMLLAALERLVMGYKRQGDYERALVHARRLVSEDPWREAAHREVMRFCHLLGRDSEALKQFETCCQTLAEELGTEPSSETVALAREIAQFSESSLAIDLPVMAAPVELVLEGAATPELPLVGRERERSQLLTHVDGLMRGLGGVVLVEGEAGVGKTRLLQTLARDTEWRGAEVLWGAGRGVERTAPYGPLVEALGRELTPLRVGQLGQLVEGIWLQVLAPLLPPLAAQLPDLPPPALDPAQERDRLVAALARVLAGWAQITPLLLVLEDLHRVGEDTLDLLIRLAPGTGACGVLIVGSYRGAEAHALPGVWERLQALDHAGVQRRLELAGLDVDATGELVRRCLGTTSAAPLFEARLYQETRGNPLFVLETLRTLQTEGLLVRDYSGRWSTPWDEATADYAELPLPPAVEQTIARRLDSLSPALRRIIHLAAVLGERFGFDLLRAASDAEPQALLAAVRQLVQRHFLDETERDYHFHHDKIRQVAYDGIDKATRREFHRQAAQALAGLVPDQPATLAYHWTQAEAWKQAADCHQQAGDKARAVYANAEAVAHYTEALAALDRLPKALEQKCAVLLAREAVYDLLGNRSAQAEDLHALENVAAMLNDARRGKVALRRANYANAVGDYPQAIASAKVVIASAKAGSVAIQGSFRLGQMPQTVHLEAEALRQWGAALERQGEYQAARAQLGGALALARNGQLHQLEAKVLINLAKILTYEGHYEQSKSHLDRALLVYRQVDDRLGEAQALTSLGTLVWAQGDNAESMAFFEQALAINRDICARRNEGILLHSLGTLSNKKCDYATARSYHEQALSIFQEIGDREGEGVALVTLGIEAYCQGDGGGARSFAEQAQQVCRQIGTRRMEGWALSTLGRLSIHQGDHTGAGTYLDQALQISREVGDQPLESLVLHILSLLAHYCTDDETAQELSQQALRIARKLDDAVHIGNALTTLGHALAGLGNLHEAADAYLQAVDLRRRQDQHSMAMEPVAGLARISLLQGELDQAQVWAEVVLEHLVTRSLDGAEDPFRVYLTCYQVLEAKGESRAEAVLTTAHDLLQERAAQIDDEALRHSFLENVAAHREIVATYQARQAAPQKKRVTVRLPRADAPQGRPLHDDEYVSVTWTLSTPEDASITDKADRRQRCLLRLLHEARSQGAIPRDQDLAEALGVSLATLRRDLAALRDLGCDLPPRRRRK